MTYKEMKLKMRDGKEIYLYKWELDEGVKPKGVIQLIHGMAEYGSRYDRFAKELVKDGFIVYADDHRGHGKSAESLSALGYISDNDGFHDMVHDQREINNFIKEENPSLDIYIFSHSMGSFIAQRYMEIYGDTVKGVILSGTGGKPNASMNMGIFLSKVIMNLRGRRASGRLMDDLGFGNYNKLVENQKTKYDWLSRDEEEVEKYILDPYCGGVFPVSFFYDFLKGMKAIHKKDNLVSIPKNLSITMFSGDKDPVGNYGKGILSLVDTFKSLGIKNLSYKLYEGGRHEILNEINRDMVTEDIKACLNSWVKGDNYISSEVITYTSTTFEGNTLSEN
ncbi:MAG TPA: alpha/beta hydrolase [Clostridium sp.]|uniref:alpha/beta hydrolase n=1 Tax=Clostridium sulfidigenes TaxID=318464 RepID=UPI000A01A0FB|nr:alpha/beta hydrolase [Clostridium sulfidigenes]HCO73638.1 alpha/beta hydrolase [Clostridium sp.]